MTNEIFDDNKMKEIMSRYSKILEENDLDISNPNIDDLSELLGFDMEAFSDEFEDMFKSHTISFQKIHEDAKEPSYVYPTDSGFDLYSVEKLVLEPFGRAAVPTGLKFQFNENLELQIRPKSGLALNLGLTVLNTPGTVDHGYTGEIKVILFNTNNQHVIIEKGMKIAQAVLVPVVNGKYVTFLETDSLDERDRGDNGFGSTGI